MHALSIYVYLRVKPYTMSCYAEEQAKQSQMQWASDAATCLWKSAAYVNELIIIESDN